jgi:hypothetical protein
MLKLQNEYIHQNENIDVYFVTFNNFQQEDVKLIDNVINIKGCESYINILYKTLVGLEYIHNNISSSYDFVVRTNISTLINLNNLYDFLLTVPNKNIYTGGTLETLKWMLQTYEISENKQAYRNYYYGLKYIQGTSIIMSYDVVKSIFKIKQNIEYDIVDDVKLGILIRDNLPQVYKNIETNPYAKVSYNQYKPDSVFIRNRSYNRINDIFVMKHIIHNHFITSTQK